jgi:hypothetical protein
MWSDRLRVDWFWCNWERGYADKAEIPKGVRKCLMFGKHWHRCIVLLFICDIFNDAVSSSDYTASNYGMITELKRIWKEVFVRYYPGTCLKALRKSTENLSHDSRSAGRDLYPGPPESEAGVLTTLHRHSVPRRRWKGNIKMGLK